LAVTLVLGLTAAGTLAVDAAPPLRVGIAPNYPPLAFKEDGQLKGIEVDFASRLGTQLGREVVLVETPWEDLPKALLEDKTIDVVMSGTSITEKRKERGVSFTTPYLEVGQMVLVREADFLELRDPAAMDRPTSRVGFISRSTGDTWARKHLKKAKLHGYTTTDEGVAALQNNQIDFFIQDAPAVWRVTGGFLNENPHLKGLYSPLTKEYLAWAVAKDNPTLLAQLNKVLAQWKKDGTIDDVLDDWITVRKTSIEVVPHQH
jgi:polar amino acid transport system substrate-binding protein